MNAGTDVRLLLCQHGRYYLTVGNVTLSLSERELAYVGRAIASMAQSRPALDGLLQCDAPADPIDPPEH